MERVMRRVSDRRVLSLIKMWLEAGVMEDGRETKLLSGTPQGGVISKINPVLRGWGGYFATGNAASKFNQVDSYVWMRPRKLMRRRKGRNLRAGEMNRWTSDAFYELGVHRLRGTVRYPGHAQLPRSERPPVSRVREIRMHGLNGGLTHIRRKTEEG